MAGYKRSNAVQEMESLWIAMAQKGDPEGFTNLVEAYQSPVYNLCYRMLNNAVEAEDAAQETFLRAYMSIKRYDRNRPFATWLLSIAAHYCIDQIRKRRMSIVSVEDMPYLELSDDSPGPESTVSRLEEQHRIQAILDILNPVDRAAVVMYYWYELSYEEIAQSLNLSMSAVKSRLHRARRSMAMEWEQHDRHRQTEARENHGTIKSPAF
jgi:RNA polymerase sigma-70 factor (ECF subfamily)